MLRLNTYLSIAKDTEVFQPLELEILQEVLKDYINNPQTSYIVFEEAVEDTVGGFVVFGKIALTVFSWDIYWLAVKKGVQGRGIGRKLIKRVEAHILQQEEEAVIRIETSERKEYAQARSLYFKEGFSQVGIIRNFYAQDDNLILFSKELKRPAPKGEEIKKPQAAG